MAVDIDCNNSLYMLLARLMTADYISAMKTKNLLCVAASVFMVAIYAADCYLHPAPFDDFGEPDGPSPIAMTLTSVSASSTVRNTIIENAYLVDPPPQQTIFSL